MDSVNIVRLIKEGYEDTPAKDLGELDDLKVLEFVNFALRHSFVLVADQSGRALGSIAVTPIRIPWCATLVMTEQWFAVTEAYRTRRVPEQLLEALEQFLDKHQQPVLLGTQMLTPASMNAVIAKRRRYVPSRQTFLRIPARPAQQAPSSEPAEEEAA